MDQTRPRVDRSRWLNLVRNTLVPARLLIPAGPGLHEWSPSYRDMIFAMAGYLRKHGGVATIEAARAFCRMSGYEILKGLPDSDVCLLMAKSLEYGLPMGGPGEAAAGKRGPRIEREGSG